MDNSPISKLGESYEKSPIIRALIQLIPFGVGSAVDVGAVTFIQSLQAKRLRIFFDELNNGEFELNEELIRNDDFLHCYFVATSAALRSRRAEKIKLFARLLHAATINGQIQDIDEYEDLSEILLELSFREFLILIILEKLEEVNPIQSEENELQRASKIWDSFTAEVERRLNIPPTDLNPILTRISRTGCYEEFVGGYSDYAGGKGKTTTLFNRIKSLVLDHQDT